MRAAVLEDYKTDLVVQDVPTPEPGPGEVLLQVAGCGLCRSDLHLRDGDVPMVPSFPWVLGHEVSGRVEAVGDGVEALEPGLPVLVFGGWGCGHCRVCLGGTEQLCDTRRWVGIGRPGGYADKLVVPAARHLVPLGDLDPVRSAPLADAALTPYHAIRLAGDRLRPGSTAVVVGIGGLGQFAVQLLRLLPAVRVVAIDVDESKRQHALALGASVALHPDELTGSLEGAADVVLDVVGSDDSLRVGARALGRQGALVLIGLGGGVLPVGFLGIPPEAMVVTSYWGTRNELAEVVALAQAGRLELDVQTRPLEQAHATMEDLRHGRITGRAVLVP